MRKFLSVASVIGVGVVVAVALGGRRRQRRAPAPTMMSTNRSRRTAQLARMGAATGSSYVGMRARSSFASAERRDELRTEFELQSVAQVVETLGGMKGALMKLGQMASYLDQGLPEHVRDALAQLQSDAPPMACSLVEQMVRDELGGEPDVVFERFDRKPIASASIGQVHRARTRDGREVAVKVQYPGVDAAVASDLENTDLLFQLMGMLFPGLEPGPIVEELRARLVEELDYRTEADNQRLFVEAYRGHPFIHVPDVVDELSTGRILTTEFAEGSRFAEVVGWPEEERQLTAECLFRFAFGGIYGLHAFNGDPHPGNYLFRPGGQVTFLDYGLCKRFSPDEVQVFEEMIEAIVIDHDIARFRQIVERIGILAPGLDVDDDSLAEYFGHFYEFVLEDGEAEMTPEYSSESVRRFFDLGGPHAEIMKAANLPPSMVIIQRINLGLYALFGDLRARNNWRRIAEELWPFVDREPSTPMGRRIAEWEAQRSDRPSLLDESDRVAEDRS